MILASVKEDLLKMAGEAVVPPAVAAAEGQAAVVPRAAVMETAYARTGYHLDAVVVPATVVPAAGVLDRHGFFLETITGVDWLQERQMEVIYDFAHPQELCRVVLRLRVARVNPEVPTISGVFPGADWHERETHDFFGIRFAGLANPGPFLLAEDATFHPLLKDYGT